MKVIALVPMKGNSERVPGKNIAEFIGRPLCHWILMALLSAEMVDEIIVNTDSREIEQEVKNLSASITVIPRPENICGDYVSINRVIAHDVASTDADVYVQTHVTNPLLASDTIDAAVRLFMEQFEIGAADSLFSVTRHQCRFYDKNLAAVNHDPATLLPTQHLEPLFEENSSLYVFTRESFSATNGRIGRRPGIFETSTIESVDIDTPDDFLLAEAVARGRRAADTASAI